MAGQLESTMTDRLDFRPIFKAYWKSLSYDKRGNAELRVTHPDLIARGIVIGAPLGVTALTALLDASIHNATAFLSGTALLSGIFLAVFAQLSTLRSRYSSSEPTPQDQHVRDLLDESVSGILVAEMAVLTATVLLAVGLGVSPNSSVCGILAWITSGVLAFVVVALLMLLPNLLYAYDQANDVDPSLSGFHNQR